jgi:hypothetical protein
MATPYPWVADLSSVSIEMIPAGSEIHSPDDLSDVTEL